MVEWRDDVANRNGVVSETENTIESGSYASKRGCRSQEGWLPAESESETWLLGSLGEVHLLHREITHGEDVVRDEAFHRTRAIADFNTSSVGLVGGRGTGIVFRVEETRDGCALGAGNPKVTRSTTGT